MSETTQEKVFTSNIQAVLAREFAIKPWQVENTVALLDEGATIPFIARYRKEKTGELDDQTIRNISDRLGYLRNLDTRKQEVYTAILGQEKMTDEIEKAISNAVTLAEVEDIYRPFRPKRKTRASIAKEKGLEPLAKAILEQNKNTVLADILPLYINEEKGVLTNEDALKGAMDIIAEDVSDNTAVRTALKRLYNRTGIVESRGDEEKESVYTQYYDFQQPVNKIASHRVLALNRGEKEGFLKVNISVDTQSAINEIEKIYIKGKNECADVVKEAIADGYSRLIHPSLDTEIRNTLTDVANEGAIKLFGDNLRQLLLVPPVKDKVCLALDPGYRTGCKMAVVDATGKVLEVGVVYMTLPNHNKEIAKKTLKSLIKKHSVDIISIGNGTATKETEMFVASMLKELDRKVSYMVVSEAGASVYSASKLAADEFPDYDVSLRSAVSIARRLQDPLAELVKIDPKSIGVGQYQHDMPKARLEESLDGVVEYCVNTVGVDLNTASAPLLERVSGLNKTIAKNIVAYREENGRFTKRNQLMKVSKLGPKAFLLSAGFLRIPGAKDKLDSSSVHPESYDVAKKLLAAVGYTADDIGSEKIRNLPEDAEKIGLEKLAQQLETGVPTLKDIISELVKPGRDMRDDLPSPLLREDVLDMADLKPGMQLKGTVRNVIDFGAFVDIGVHQDGLVHLSQICDRYIRHPSEEVKVGDVVDVWVLSVDVNKKRISLTMRKPKEIKESK
ncbi:MAG: RNA-binding transcriptional accessory protein [Oscillospiraceae bacterium]|nr:RNA-binding transcriptional accessory protein [Oscillospiraceae bacterium]